MYTASSGTTGVSAPNVAVTTTSGGNLAITANIQVNPAPAPDESRAVCEVTLDGTSLDQQEVTVPAALPSPAPNPGGQTITLVGTGTASGSGVVRVQCSAVAAGVTFSNVRIQAISVDAIN
jgi:hypothetical protein